MTLLNYMMLKVNRCNIGTVTQEKAPLLKTIMKYEFKPCLEEYSKYSNSRIKTLKDIVEYYESNPDTMMKYGCGLLKEALLCSSYNRKTYANRKDVIER